jgi:glycosyltransferase involved in cell wall biosynthesis
MFDKQSHAVLILGLDTFAAKNISQILEMNKKGYFYIILTNDLRKDSGQVFSQLDAKNELIILPPNLLKKIFYLLQVLLRNQFHHVELYAAGRMTLFYLIILKIFGIKILTVERGDIGIINDYSKLTKASLVLAYRFSNHIWFKEPYMENLLIHFGAKELTMLPNAVPIENKNDGAAKQVEYSQKNIDFLWVNRIIRKRRCDWLIESMGIEELKHANLVVVGVEDNSLVNDKFFLQEIINNNKLQNVEMLGFQNPFPFYHRAKFFVLPTEIVFGNNSLLESMSQGVVPIVSDTQSTSLVVQHDVNGIVFPHSKEGLLLALKYAHNLSAERWAELSFNARKYVFDNYSLEKWGSGLQKIYKEISS